MYITHVYDCTCTSRCIRLFHYQFGSTRRHVCELKSSSNIWWQSGHDRVYYASTASGIKRVQHRSFQMHRFVDGRNIVLSFVIQGALKACLACLNVLENYIRYMYTCILVSNLQIYILVTGICEVYSIRVHV